MRITSIKRQINDDARRGGHGSNGWGDFLARLAAFTARMSSDGMSEPEFARRALPVMQHEQEILLGYLHRAGRLRRRGTGIDRRVFACPPNVLRTPGRPRRSTPIDAVEREIHRAFSESMTALVDAVEQADESAQRLAAAALMKAAGRLIRRGVTWAAIRAALRVYRPDAVALVRRHETAFDLRSGECVVELPPAVPRSRRGASLADRVLRAVEAAGPRGVTRSRLLTVARVDAAALTAELARLKSRGVLVARESRGEGQGSRAVVRYSLGQGRPADVP